MFARKKLLSPSQIAGELKLISSTADSFPVFTWNKPEIIVTLLAELAEKIVPLADGIDQDQTAQNVQSDLGSMQPACLVNFCEFRRIVLSDIERARIFV